MVTCPQPTGIRAAGSETGSTCYLNSLENMASLRENERRKIVQRLACFETPTEVAKWASEEFGKEVTANQVHHYDPTRAQDTAEKWEKLFQETRQEFLEDLETIPLSHRAVRLRELTDLYEKAKESGQLGKAARMLKQAAKEVGEKFTNLSEVDVTSDGEQISVIDFNPPDGSD